MAQRYFVPTLPPAGPAEVTGDLAHHLRVLRVQPGARIVLMGNGLGSRMLATTLEMAEARGLGRVELVVRADNETAIALYRRFGFVEEGRCRQYLRLDGVGHDALLMARLASDPAR